MRFFTGLHQPSDAKHFDDCFISVNRLRPRVRHFPIRNWIMDSGAFTEISTFGYYRDDVGVYAREIRRWVGCGNLLAAVAQDWMCEAHILKKTGLTVETHQRHTIARYDALLDEQPGVYVLPVLQGYTPREYVQHLAMYGQRLAEGQWVGVGSICKRNGNPRSIVAVLSAIKDVRPDLQLHGFGLKTTALRHQVITDLLHTADSMAWSYNARKNGRNANDWREARAWTERMLRPRPPAAQMAMEFTTA